MIFYNLMKGLSNLVVWAKTIWKDRDFDYYFIYSLLLFKLKRVLKNLDHTEASSPPLIEAIALLERLAEEEYYEETWVRLNVQRGKFDWDSAEDESQIAKMVKETQFLSDKQRREDRENLFLLLSKNIENWWD